MAKYNIETILTTDHGRFKSSQKSRNYNEIHDNVRIVDNSDVPEEILNLQNTDGTTGKGLALDGARTIKLTNEGRVTIELFFKINP